MNFDFKCGVICHFPYNISTNHYLLPFPLPRKHNPRLDLRLSVLTFSKSFTFPSPSFAFLSISSGTGICSFSLNMCLMLGCANVNTPSSVCVCFSMYYYWKIAIEFCKRCRSPLPPTHRHITHLRWAARAKVLHYFLTLLLAIFSRKLVFAWYKPNSSTR